MFFHINIYYNKNFKNVIDKFVLKKDAKLFTNPSLGFLPPHQSLIIPTHIPN